MSRLSGQAVYDTDINITWLDNTNLAKTYTFGLPRATPPFGTVGVTSIDSQGETNWYTAEAWIDAINTQNYLGISTWRLPNTVQPDTSCSYQSEFVSTGDKCVNSEIGHLFYLV